MGDLLFASRREGVGRFVFARGSEGRGGWSSVDHFSYCDCFGSLCSGGLIYLRTLLKQSGNPSLYNLQHRSNGTYLPGREQCSHP